MSTRISVVIPTWQRAEVLPRCLRSVLDQRGADFEVIVVDDGSTDHTARVVEDCAAPNVRYVHQGHSGVSAARNRGVQESRSELVTFLDSDDEALPGWLEALCQALGHADVAVACCGVREQLPDATRDVLPTPRGAELNNWNALFLAGSFALPKELFVEIGGYWEPLSYAENTELSLRLAQRCRRYGGGCYAIQEPFVVYHRHRFRESPLDAAAITTRLESSRRLLRRHLKLLQRNPRHLGNILDTAGVRAARLGDLKEARRFFLRSIQAEPFGWKHWGRFLASLVPDVAHLVWKRAEEGEPHSIDPSDPKVSEEGRLSP